MNKIILVFILVVAFIFRLFESNGQLTDSIVAINNDTTGSLYFCKINIANGGITNYQMVSNGLSSLISTCINYDTKEFYISFGQSFKTIDAISANIISTTNFPIASTATFTCLKFNKCDSCIYGIITDAQVNSFAKYNTTSGIMTVISGMPAGPCWGCMTVLDPDSNLLIMDTGNSIAAIDITTGQLKYSALKVNLWNESFGHIALNCQTHEIFGTSAAVNLGVKYLSKINPRTGVVTHVTINGWNTGVWKPGGGGDCINQLTGDYFYSGAGGLLLRVNSTTGNIISNPSVTPGNLLFVDHFSTCECKKTITGFNEIENEAVFNYDISSREISIQANTDKNYAITIYDISGKMILTKEFRRSLLVNTFDFTPGFYCYEIKNGSGDVLKGKFVR